MKRLFAGLLVAAALPAHAGLFDDDEARARVDRLRAEITEISARVDTAAKNQLDFANQVEAIKADLARLRGQVEVLLYELDAAQKRQKDFYVDLDNRLRKLEAPAAGAAEGKPDGAAKPADPMAESRDYEAALTAFKGGKYKDALALFVNFIKAYPQSTLQASAHYWTASSHYQLRDYGKAVDMFAKVASGWPDDPKAPDALLGEANAQFEVGDAKGGRKTLEALVAAYPSSSAAQTAKQRLKKK